MAELGADALKSNLSNPARTYMWECVFPNPVGGGDAKTLLLRCQSTSIPGRSVGTISVPFKQTAGMVYAGKITYTHTWNCTFIEGEDGKVFDAINEWQNAMIDGTTGVGVGDATSKIDIYLTLLTTAGETYKRIKMIGCFPISRDEVALSSGDEGTISYSVSFSYDRWEDA